MPGAAKEDADISFLDDVLTIRVGIKDEVAGNNRVYSERGPTDSREG